MNGPEPTGVGILERRRRLDLRPDVLRHDELEVQVCGDELRIRRLERDGDAERPDLLDRGDVRVRAVEADDVHRVARVLLAGGQAVDHVGGGQRLAVRPLDVGLDLQVQRLLVATPRPALRQPGVDVTALGDNRDRERLVDRALHDLAVVHGPVYGLKLRVNAASPEPTMTTHGCAPAAGAACCAGRADAPGARIAATAATAPTTAAVTRPERAARAGLFILPTPFGSSPAPAARGGSSTDSSRHPATQHWIALLPQPSR